MKLTLINIIVSASLGYMNNSELVTDRASREATAVGPVRPSVRLFPVSRLNQLTFDLDFLQAHGS